MLNKRIEGTQRQSNIELLRLLSMLMVLIVHANSLANKMPCCTDVPNTLPTIMRIMVQTFANVNVDVFVLISGFFGIRLRMGGVMNILFQSFFYTIVAAVICLMFFPETFNVASLTKSLYFGSCWWFLVSYLGLMIVSPVLNNFVEHTDKQALKRFLMVYFLFEMVYGWLCLDEAHFINGYSLISFIGLYLLARYVRLYPSRWFMRKRSIDMLMYILMSLFSGGIIFFSLSTGNETISQIMSYKMLAYNSPFCILGALSLFLFFVKLDIGFNKIVNWLASSCFAIFLLHTNPLIKPKYLSLMQYIYQSFDSVLCIVIMFVSILVIAILCILIDKLRIVLWNRINYVGK